MSSFPVALDLHGTVKRPSPFRNQPDPAIAADAAGYEYTVAFDSLFNLDFQWNGANPPPSTNTDSGSSDYELIQPRKLRSAKILVSNILSVFKTASVNAGSLSEKTELVLVLRSHDIWRVYFRSAFECHTLYSKLMTVHRQRHYHVTSVLMSHAIGKPMDSPAWTWLASPQELMKRTKLSPESWRVSTVNQEFQLSAHLPQEFIVPREVDDEMLRNVSRFRALQRIAHIVYHQPKTKAVLARSSQPLMGSKNRRSTEDEQYLQMVLRPSLDRQQQQPCLIDVRTKANAYNNKMKGGGFEADGQYTGIRMFFTNVEDTSGIREAYHRVLEAHRNLDISTSAFSTEVIPWMKLIQSCLRPAIFLSKAIAVDGVSCLVHCDDGLDSSAVIVSLAKIIMDPFYRTLEGWMTLVEEDWIHEGYRFVDSITADYVSPNSDATTLSNTISALTATLDTISSSIASASSTGSSTPAAGLSTTTSHSFVLFLDCVHQIITQFPLEFEYNLELLLFTHQNSQSSIFGNFLYTTPKERIQEDVTGKTLSLWPFLRYHRALFVSSFYRHASGQVPLFSEEGGVIPLPVTVNSKRLNVWRGLFDPWDPCNPHVDYHRYKHGLLAEGALGKESVPLEDLYERLDVPCAPLQSDPSKKVWGASLQQAAVRAMKQDIATFLQEAAADCADVKIAAGEPQATASTI